MNQKHFRWYTGGTSFWRLEEKEFMKETIKEKETEEMMETSEN